MQYFCELSKEKQAKETHTRNVSQFTTFYYQLNLLLKDYYVAPPHAHAYTYTHTHTWKMNILGISFSQQFQCATNDLNYRKPISLAKMKNVIFICQSIDKAKLYVHIYDQELVFFYSHIHTHTYKPLYASLYLFHFRF